MVSGPKTVVKLYGSDKVESKVKKGDVEKFIALNLKKSLLKPHSDNVTDIKDFDAYDLEIKETDERDIGIAGLGWVHLEGNNQLFRIHVPKGVYVYTTRSKVKDVK